MAKCDWEQAIWPRSHTCWMTRFSRGWRQRVVSQPPVCGMCTRGAHPRPVAVVNRAGLTDRPSVMRRSRSKPVGTRTWYHRNKNYCSNHCILMLQPLHAHTLTIFFRNNMLCGSGYIIYIMSRLYIWIFNKLEIFSPYRIGVFDCIRILTNKSLNRQG